MANCVSGPRKVTHPTACREPHGKPPGAETCGPDVEEESGDDQRGHKVASRSLDVGVVGGPWNVTLVQLLLRYQLADTLSCDANGIH